MVAMLPIPKPESCRKCILCIDMNAFSGTCIINRDKRMKLNDKRSDECQAIFMDVAFEALMKWSDDREYIS